MEGEGLMEVVQLTDAVDDRVSDALADRLGEVEGVLDSDTAAILHCKIHILFSAHVHTCCIGALGNSQTAAQSTSQRGP